MGVEALGSIGLAMGSIAEGLGGAASVSGPAAPAVAGLAKFGPKMVGLSSPIVNEGPVAPSFLENTMPLQIGQKNPITEISFQSQPMLNAADAVVEAESILAQARIPGPKEVFPVIWPQVESVVVPLIQPQLQSQTEARVVNQPAQATFSEELVEEKVKVEEQKEVLGEEAVMEKRLYLEDQEASAVRRQEIRQAVIKTKVEAGRSGLKKITGWLVAKFLPGEHEGNRSQVVKKTGPDGSYQETVEAIAGTGELESEEQALVRFDKVVAEKKPVKMGKNGNLVGSEDVARVFRYRIFKPAPVYEIVIKRAKRQIMQVVPGWETEAKVEKSLEELDPILAEVFQG